MMTLQVFVFICALSWTSGKKSRDCDFGWEVYNCLSKMRFDVTASFKHFMDEEKLNNSCRKFMPAAECMVELAEWCTRNREALMESVFDTHRFMMDICQNDVDFKREYLKHGPCLNENKSEYLLDCYDGVPAPEHQNPDEEDCQTFKNTTETCGYDIQRTCGDDAVAMVARMKLPIINYYMRSCQTL